MVGLFVIIAAGSSGLGGVLVVLGMLGLGGGVVAAARGRLRLLRLATRKAGLLTAGAGLAVTIVGGAISPAPAANTSAAPAHGASTTAVSATPSASSSPTQSPTTATASPTPVAVPTSALPSTSAPAVVPAVASGGAVVNGSGAILPNATRTPGAVNGAVTQATIHQTICVSGWTATIRPPSSYTTALKRSQLASGYAYHGDLATSDYEEDHLISLELGGSPSAEANLWPEPYSPALGARKKDVVENKLHALVCSGALSLRTAQQAIASNWWAAYQKYVPVSTTSSTPTPAAQPAPAPAPAPQAGSAPAGATALCNDGTYSFSQHRRGTCSHHGGVAVWL